MRSVQIIIPFLAMIILSISLLSRWSFANDDIDGWISLICIFGLPLFYVSVIERIGIKILIYIISVLFLFVFVSLLTKDGGRVVCEIDGMIIKEGSWDTFLDSGSIYTLFNRSKSYPFLEEITDYRATSYTMDYRFYDHSVKIDNKTLFITFFDEDHSKKWKTDTLCFK